MRQVTPPTAREKVYDLYWIFAARRQAAFERRVSGAPWPWTDDPIIQTYKFCNVFRAADRVSQYLIRHVAYHSDDSSYADRALQILIFRTFSKIETWNELCLILGRAPRIEDLRSGALVDALTRAKARLGGLYTGAFILCATKAFGFNEKHLNHAALFKHMFIENNAADRIRDARTLEELVKFLQSFPLTGPFMSYQIAIDLNYSELVSFDEDDYTQAGPGALRGIAKAFSDLGSYSHSDIIQYMVDRQNLEFNRLGLTFNGLWGRPLHAIDCQNLFCEVDKYCREAAPYLTSNRTRIKARFSSSKRLADFFFPPKWGINDRLPTQYSKDSRAQLELFPQQSAVSEVRARPRSKLHSLQAST